MEMEVQKKFLALWVQDPTFLEKYRRFCKATFFSQDDLYTVGDQILRHFDRNVGPPDEIILVQRLRFLDKLGKKKFDLPAAVRLVRAIYAENIVGSKATLTDWVLEFGKIEQTKAAFRKGIEYLKEGKYDDIQSTVTKLVDYYHAEDEDESEDGFVEESLSADLARRRVRVKQRVTTGITCIDHYLGGGWGIGQFYVLAGGTGVGKTTAAVNFCRGAVHNLQPTLLISTETQRDRIVDKYHAAITGIPTGLDQVELEGELKQKLDDYFEQRKRLFRIKYFEPFTKTMSDVRHYINKKLRGRENFHPKLVVIDSPDLLLPQRLYTKPHEGLAEIYTSVFAMAGKENVAVVTTSDVKQASRDKLLIGVTDLGGTYEKGKKPDGVFGLGRDLERKKIDPETRNFKLWLNIDKLRSDGSSGMVMEITVTPHLGRWSVVTPLSNKAVIQGLKESLANAKAASSTKDKDNKQW